MIVVCDILVVFQLLGVEHTIQQVQMSLTNCVADGVRAVHLLVLDSYGDL